jgi:hypothetical protein
MEDAIGRLPSAPPAPATLIAWRTARRVIGVAAIGGVVAFLIPVIGVGSTLVVGLIVWLIVKLGTSGRGQAGGVYRGGVYPAGVHFVGPDGGAWGTGGSDCGGGYGSGGDCGGGGGSI